MTKKSAPVTSAATKKRGTPAKAKTPQPGKVAKSPDVFTLLRERIVSHEIAPGSRLREQELADEYGAPRA
ncbi:MAG: GntR family transcriptional regulator, partial [Burkholderiales bacterium]|nr:GntR family transcriptional regulator [Burkholderiales bacterium]